MTNKYICPAYTTDQKLDGMCFLDCQTCDGKELYEKTGICHKLESAEKVAQIIFPDKKSLESKV